MNSDLYDGDYGDSQYQELCIRYKDVNRAIKEAIHTLRYKRPKGIDSMEPPPDMIGETAEVTLEATRILTFQYVITTKRVLNGFVISTMILCQ